MGEDAERLFERALALEPERRRALVETACRDDPALREELMSLLEQAGAAERFFGLLHDVVFAASYSSGGAGSFPLPGADPGLAPGGMVGPYRILSLLGRGGMGAVYRAHDPRLDRDVALKFLPPDLDALPDARERLLMEARAAAVLEHPNVCSIHEIGETETGRRFIAMACYEGETLKERLQRGPMSVEESVATAAQIARGLAAAHARRIIHRDVKPGNVMLGLDGTVRILDFGLAMTAGPALARPGITPGTLAYMSPEQARGDALDPRTDLWSLGVVLYEMLAAARPFRGASAAALRTAILDEAAAPIAGPGSGLPEGVARIVERLLRKDVATRYQSATEVVTDLARALPAEAAPVPSGAGPWRRRLALLGGSTMLLVAAAAAVVWFRAAGRDSSAGLSPARVEPSIAVLPLANLSADPRDAPLAAGITEELIGTLASAGDVRVIASTSSARFTDREMDVRLIADSLGVANVLEGTIQKIGGQLRVQVRLVAGRDGSTRWSQAYDREFNELLSVPDEIVRAVAGELELRFDKDRQLRRHQTRSLAAYELYLRGSDPVLLRSESGVWKALDFFQQAIAADSGYAAAYAGLALVHIRRGRTTSDPGMPLRELFALAERLARKAVALDESLPEAHYVLGRVLEAQLEFPAAETAIRRAIALDPARSIYRRSLAYLHSWAGRPEQELAEARRALETDPLNPYAHAAVAGGLFGTRRYEEALAAFQRVAVFQPPLQAVAFGIAQCYWKQGRLADAIAALRPQAEAGDRLYRGLLGHLLARAGQRAEAHRLLADLLAHQERSKVGAFQVAMVYSGLGDLDQAFAWLDRSIDDRTIGSMVMGPTFEDLRRDPRFPQLRRRLGLQK